MERLRLRVRVEQEFSSSVPIEAVIGVSSRLSPIDDFPFLPPSMVLKFHVKGKRKTRIDTKDNKKGKPRN